MKPYCTSITAPHKKSVTIFLSYFYLPLKKRLMSHTWNLVSANFVEKNFNKILLKHQKGRIFIICAFLQLLQYHDIVKVSIFLHRPVKKPLFIIFPKLHPQFTQLYMSCHFFWEKRLQNWLIWPDSPIFQASMKSITRTAALCPIECKQAAKTVKGQLTQFYHSLPAVCLLCLIVLILHCPCVNKQLIDSKFGVSLYIIVFGIIKLIFSTAERVLERCRKAWMDIYQIYITLDLSRIWVSARCSQWERC